MKLHIYRRDTLERTLDLTGHDLRIGRGAENDVVLEDADKTVSRFHAELRFENDEWILIDLNSQNGSWIDGERIQRASLAPGDDDRARALPPGARRSELAAAALCAAGRARGRRTRADDHDVGRRRAGRRCRPRGALGRGAQGHAHAKRLPHPRAAAALAPRPAPRRKPPRRSARS